MSTPALSAHDLVVAAPGGRVILHGVTLALNPGEKVALVGPNGSGKTTLLRTLAGLWRPQSGEVRLGAKNLHRLRRRELARELAYLPQQTTASFELTARQVVAQGLFPHGGLLAPAQRRERVSRAMQATQVSDLAQRLLPSLSGGERQRVLLARAVAQGAPVLLLDEPATALDIRHQLDLMDLMDQFQRQGVTQLCSLHDLQTAALRFDRVVVLAAGRVLADGPPAQVFAQPGVAACFEVSLTLEHHPGGALKALHCCKP